MIEFATVFIIHLTVSLGIYLERNAGGYEAGVFNYPFWKCFLWPIMIFVTTNKKRK